MINMFSSTIHLKMHTCYSCIACSSCDTPNRRSRDCFWLCCPFSRHFASSGLPCSALIWEEMTCLAVSLYAMADWYTLRPTLFWKEEEVNVGRNWEEKREGNCDQAGKNNNNIKYLLYVKYFKKRLSSENLAGI